MSSFEGFKIAFAESKLPKFKENKQKGFISYGEKNDYPESLIELYKRSPKHGSIVRQKSRYITGSDVTIDGNASAVKLADYVNPFEGLQDLKAKIALDYELFNGFALAIHYNRLAQIGAVYHIDFSKVRTLDHNGYLYTEDWKRPKDEDIIRYKKFNPAQAEPMEVQLYYYREYDAGLGVYPLPPYIHALQYIQIDVEIANFHNNNILNGFSNGTLVQLFKGEPTPEQARQFKKMFKGETTGTDNAGGVLIQFNEGNERAAEINHIQPSDMDKQFLTLNETVQSEMFVAHAFPKILLGVSVEGALGQRNELVEAYEVFHKSYVTPRRQKIDRSLAYVFDAIYPGVTLETQNAEFIGLDYVALYSVGLVDRSTAQRALGLEQTPTEQQFNTDHEYSRWNDNDIDVFSKFGEDAANFELIPMNFAELSADEKKVLAAVKSNDKASVKNISEATKIAEPDVLEILKKLEDSGKINWTNNAVKITDIGNDAIKDSGKLPALELRYSYEVSPEAKKLPLKGESRDFCQRLTGLSRLYTREDIDRMTAILGYDVWQRRGGWWTIPDSDPALRIPHCRHEWRQKIVRRKNNG
jgi:DNA-binding MarR family transcriptional regulator